VLEHLVGRADGEHGTLVEGDEPIGDRGHEGHVVLDDQQGRSEAVPQLEEQRRQRLRLTLGDARRRLVEEDDRRALADGTGEVDHAP